MASRAPRGGWTYEAFARLPAETAERYEVIAGELYVTPSPRPRHQIVLSNLLGPLDGFVRRHGLGRVVPGPVDVLFAEGDYLAPDLVFVRRDRLAIVTDRGIEGPPDLVVEVVSDSTAARDRGIKRERYARYGVPEYWVADPGAGRIDVYRLAAEPGRAEPCAAELVWRPVPGGPELVVSVADVLRGLD